MAIRAPDGANKEEQMNKMPPSADLFVYHFPSSIYLYSLFLGPLKFLSLIVQGKVPESRHHQLKEMKRFLLEA